MEAHVVFALSLAIFFHGAQSATVTFINSCSFTVWPATLTGAGSQLSTTGFELAPFNSFTIDVPAPWSGRFWGRTQCADVDGKFQCATADCGTGQITCNGLGAIPPASLVEFTLAGFGLQDFFDISLVDGFNLPVSLSPLNTSQNITGNCIVTSCPTNINNICPQELQVKGTAEDVIACKSACLAFNQPQYCCTGNFGSPTTCPPTSYSNDFKAACPQAYSYAYDDQTSTFTCATGVNYNITFCPN